MADGYDRFDNEGGGGGSFVMGMLTGTVLGAGLGMLFAPKAGSELRNQLSEQAGTIANTASDGVRRAQESANQWVEKGREVYGQAAERGRDVYDKAAATGRDAYDKAKDAVNKGAEEADRYVRDTANTVPNTAPNTVPNAGPTGPRRS
jgi:gas vesicle protein